MTREQAIQNFSIRIEKWLKENELKLTVENIRRYFALKYPHNFPSERSINSIYNKIKSSENLGGMK